MLQDKIKIKKIKSHKDDRGVLAKIFDYVDLKDKHIKDIYITYTKAGQNRADHYHKKTTEWFYVIKGKCVMKFRAIETGEEFEVQLDAENTNLIEVPPGINHQVFSVGQEELIIIAFGNQPYKKEDTDTYSSQIK